MTEKDSIQARLQEFDHIFLTDPQNMENHDAMALFKLIVVFPELLAYF